jgi:hypothetical protein
MEVFLVGLSTEFKVVIASTLDVRRQRPVKTANVKIARQLLISPESVVLDDVRDLLRKLFVGDLLLVLWTSRQQSICQERGW